MNRLLADVPLGRLETLGTDLNNPGSAGATLARIVSAVIGLLTVIAVVYFMINLITGATMIITAGGDKGKYSEARQKITYGFIGLVVTIAAIFILGLLAILLDIPTLLDISQIMNF